MWSETWTSVFARGPAWLSAFAMLTAGCAAHTEPSSGAEDPPAASQALFTVDLWPGEGVPVIEARRASLVLRGAPDPDSPAVDTLRVRVGQRLVFDSTRLQTIESGRIRVLAPIHVAGRDMGTVTHVALDLYYSAAPRETTMLLTPPATVDLLQYRAEGTCFLRIERRVIDAQPCPGFGRESVTVEREPVTRWWIRVRGQGSAFGWLLVSDSTAQSVRREF